MRHDAGRSAALYANYFLIVSGLLSHQAKRLLVGLVALAVRAPRATIVLATVATAVLFYYAATGLGVNTDTAAMISPTAAFRRNYDIYKAAFPQEADAIIAVVGAGSDDAADAAAADLAARLASEPERFKGVFRPDGGAFFARNGLLYLDTDQLARLGDDLATAAPFLADLAAEPHLARLLITLGDALAANKEDVPAQSLRRVFAALEEVAQARRQGRPVSFSWLSLSGVDEEDGDPRYLVLLEPVLDFASLAPGKAALEEVRRVAAEIPVVRSGEASVRLTGPAALAEDERQSALAGATSAGILSFVLVAVLLLWGLRSVWLALATVITLVIGLIATAAFAAAAVGHLNMMSVTFAVLFTGLSVDFGIHYALRYQEEVDRGQEGPKALVAAADGVGAAVGLCALAAAIGFLAFWPTDYAGLGELGLIAAGGMGIALLTNLGVLPAILAMAPIKPERKGRGRSVVAAELWIMRRARPLLAAAVLIAMAASVYAGKARFDFDPINLKDPESESVVTARELATSNAGGQYAAALLASDMAEAGALAQRIAALPEVKQTITLESFVPKEQAAKLEAIGNIGLYLGPVFATPEVESTPNMEERRRALEGFRVQAAAYAADAGGQASEGVTQALVPFLEALEALVAEQGEQGLAAYEADIFRYFPAFLDRLRQAFSAEPVTLENLPPDLSKRWLTADGRAKVLVVPAQDLSADLEALRRFVSALQGLAPHVTGAPVVVFEAGRIVTRSVGSAGVIALVGVGVLLILALRRWLDVVFVLIPLLLAGLLTAASAVLLDVPFNFANVIALPLLLGLGVASGIQLVLRARQERGEIQLARSSTPRAVVFSALTTIGSFGTLGVSKHFGMASLGLVLTLAILFTLLCTMVVLPALLALRPKEGAE
jgi:hopanoid biosynthesis associated RND transporter like protein HpnN